jgi:hypothetical protein
MNSRVVAISIAAAVSTPCFAGECQPQAMAPTVAALVKPLMQLREQETRENYDTDGRWTGKSTLGPEVEKKFEALLSNRTKAGDQALAYLLTVYLGEGPGEELVCEVINRGKKMTPLIKAAASCAPLIGIEPLHKFIQGSGHLPGMALKGINLGKPCKYEE